MELLKQKIQADLQKALKEKDTVVTTTLRLVLAAVQNKELAQPAKEAEEASVLSDDDVLAILSAEVKKRKEAIEQFEKGGRDDLVAQEKAELVVLERYLPEQLSEDEITQLAQDAIKKTGATEKKDMGKVMGIMMKHTQGKADGALVSKIVQQLLSDADD